MNLHTAKASSPCLGFQELEKFKQMQDYSLYQCWVFFMCENQNVGVRQMAGLLQLLALQFTNHECAISQACSSKSSSSVTCVPLSLPRSYTLRVDPPHPHLYRASGSRSTAAFATAGGGDPPMSRPSADKATRRRSAPHSVDASHTDGDVPRSVRPPQGSAAL